MGCAGSAPAIEDGLEPTVPAAQAKALAKKATVVPPFPTGHTLLAGLAKALDLEHGERQEKEAVSTWMTLELEARPKSHLEELGTDLQTCCAFVADVETAVREKCVSLEHLCELWGTPEVKPRKQVVGLGQVDLEKVNSEAASAANRQVERKLRPTGDDSDIDDDLSVDRDLGGEPNPDTRPG